MQAKLVLPDASGQAYLFLLQCHKEFPNVWEHFWNFVMMNSKLTKWTMEKFFLENLQLQVSSWNFLMLVMTRDVVDRKC